MQPVEKISFNDLPDSAFIRVNKVAAMFDVSTNTIYRWVKKSEFPKARKLGANSSGWNVGELRDHQKKVMETLAY